MSEKGYEYNDAARARARSALAVIDQEHSLFPRCVLCGQRANALDPWSLCSKVSKPHEEYRESHPRRSRS